MAYEVTATRRRPQDFSQIVGQDFVVATLTKSIEQGHIAHAYLFSGPRGVGKTSAARILAKALNCETGPTAKPCGECASCQEIARGGSLDVIEIDGASNTSVNDVREIKDEVLFRPNSSRYKIYIIDEVHMLSNSAFNALLKTIEEPPPYIVFIFATTEIHRVPATIRSRCQQFNFRLISTDDLKRSLAAACSEMKVEAEESALLWIAKEATGSLRDSYTLLDQVASFSGGRITLALIHEKLGVVGLDQLNGLAAAFLAVDGKAALELLAKILEQGVAVEQLVVDMAEYFRSLLFLQQGLGREGLLGYSPESFLKQAVEQLTPAQVERAIELLLELHRNLRFSLNPRFELELVVSRLARLTGFIGPEDILAQIRKLRGEMAGGAVPAAPRPAADPPARRSAPAASAAAAAGEPDEAAGDEDAADSGDAAGAGDPADAGGQAARRVIEALRRRKPALASAMDKAEDVVVEEGRLRFTFKAAERYSVGMLNAERQAVEAAASEVLGRAVRLEVVTMDTASAAETRVDEKIEMVKRVFKGQVVDGG